MASRNSGEPSCYSQFDHGPQPYPAYSMYRNRIIGESFLWTVIREPSKRATSAFFHFQVSRKKKEPSVSNFERFLLRNGNHKNRDYYLRSLHPSKQFQRDLYDPRQAANEILDAYDFIGITERLDESAVVLSMLMHLPLADILYLKAKSHGGYDAGAQHKCVYIQPSFLSPGMERLLDSSGWQNDVKYDRELYEAANRSLDMTIDRLGRDEFDKELLRFQRAQSLIRERCLPFTKFPCDQDGRFVNETDCLWKDSGCGTTCLDQVATELGLWRR